MRHKIFAAVKLILVGELENNQKLQWPWSCRMKRAYKPWSGNQIRNWLLFLPFKLRGLNCMPPSCILYHIQQNCVWHHERLTDKVSWCSGVDMGRIIVLIGQINVKFWKLEPNDWWLTESWNISWWINRRWIQQLEGQNCQRWCLMISKKLVVTFEECSKKMFFGKLTDDGRWHV